MDNTIILLLAIAIASLVLCGAFLGFRWLLTLAFSNKKRRGEFIPWPEPPSYPTHQNRRFTGLGPHQSDDATCPLTAKSVHACRCPDPYCEYK